MEELNKKILALEKAHSSGEDVKEPPRGDGAKGFLEGIKSYKVEDIWGKDDFNDEWINEWMKILDFS